MMSRFKVLSRHFTGVYEEERKEIYQDSPAGLLNGNPVRDQ